MVFCLGVMGSCLGLVESCLEIVVAEAPSFCVVETGASIAGLVVGSGVVEETCEGEEVHSGVVEGMCEIVPSGVVALGVEGVAVALRARARWRARCERSMATSMS